MSEQITMMIVMMMMMIIIIIVIVVLMMMLIIIIIAIVFLERLSMSNVLNCAKQAQVQNIKHMHIRHPKQHVSEQSYSNIQPSSKARLKNNNNNNDDVPIKGKNRISADIAIPTIQTSYELCLLKKN